MQELGKMKKLAALFLSVLLFVGVLAGCSDKGNMTIDQAKACLLYTSGLSNSLLESAAFYFYKYMLKSVITISARGRRAKWRIRIKTQMCIRDSIILV